MDLAQCEEWRELSIRTTKEDREVLGEKWKKKLGVDEFPKGLIVQTFMLEDLRALHGTKS